MLKCIGTMQSICSRYHMNSTCILTGIGFWTYVDWEFSFIWVLYFLKACNRPEKEWTPTSSRVRKEKNAKTIMKHQQMLMLSIVKGQIILYIEIMLSACLQWVKVCGLTSFVLCTTLSFLQWSVQPFDMAALFRWHLIQYFFMPLSPSVNKIKCLINFPSPPLEICFQTLKWSQS